METKIDVNHPYLFNDTYYSRGRYPYFTPTKPKIVPMRDLSPASQKLVIQEFYDAYDPWTGIRIAIGIGVFIALFAFFLFCKSQFTRSRNYKPSTKKIPSLYLYNDMDVSDELRNISSTGDICANGLASAYTTEPNVQSSLDEAAGFQLHEISVHPSIAFGKGFSNSRTKTAKIKTTGNISRSLPCSPYSSKRQQQTPFQKTISKRSSSPDTSTKPTSFVVHVGSLGSIEEPVEDMQRKSAKRAKSSSKHSHRKQKKSA
ncbi:uncharacterized protein TNCT_435631 [Trichonephila clavata]|uniref:Uncharacterized protein n=1 Tax=Trichonephila clavata TaxID=2740835 RepID=A0A8X6LJH1_TRICU|nr:uncharacterized protein TNCT_435631 [Trichonephila clavata]